MDVADADRLLQFVDRARVPVSGAVRLTQKQGQSQREHADKLLAHWRRVGAPIVAVPATGGALSEGITDVVGAAFQGLFVLSLCDVAGEADRQRRVALVSQLALDEDVPSGWIATAPGGTFISPPRTASNPIYRRIAQHAPDEIVQVILEMQAVKGLTEQRPTGKLRHRVARKVPGIATVRAAFGERAALSGIAEKAYNVLGL